MNEATTSQAINALPPDADIGAMTPVSPENDSLDFNKLLNDKPFTDFLNRIADFATARSNSEAMWERRRKSVQLRKYILGEYYGIFDRSSGWQSAKEEGDGIYFDPATPTFIANLIKDLVKTKPRKKCVARNAEMVDKREAARVAEKLLELDDEQDFTPKRQQREWKWNLLAAGETYRITYFNTKKTGCGITKEVFEPTEIKGGDSAYFCPLCDSTVADESGKCAECGNPQMDRYEVLGTSIQVRKGTKYEQIGDVDYDVPDSLEMTVIGDTDSIAEALIIVRDRMIPRCVLADALGRSDLPSTGTPDSLHYKQMFEGRDRWNTGGDNSMPEFEMLHYQEFWVAPAVYANYAMPNDTRTQAGMLPNGAKAKELCPNGMYFSRVKKTITTVHPQAAGDCLSHTVNDIGEGFHGQGEWDLIELQDQLTEATSMKMNSMLLDSTQPLVVRDGYIDKENFENKFGLVLPVDMPKEMPLDQLMTRVKASSPPTEAYQLGEEKKGAMQQRVGAFSTTTDAPDMKAMGTATGVAAMAEQTLGRRAPALQLYAQMEVDQAYQKLELRQKYWCQKMYSGVATELGDDAVKWFMKCNIRQDISISVIHDSWMPKTEMQKQAGLQTVLSLIAPLLAAKGDTKIVDDIIRKTNEVFGGGLNLNNYETESIEAQLRLDKLREVGSFVESQFGPLIYDASGHINSEALQLAYSQTAELLRIATTPTDQADIFATLPLDVMFDDHSEFEEAYTDWLNTAEGRAASIFTRTLVRELALYHVQAVAYKTIKMKEFQNLTMLPDLEASQIEAEATNQQTLQNSADQKEQDLLYQGIQNTFMPQETRAK